MKKAMTGLLEPTFKETRLGMAAVQRMFQTPKVGTIAGCRVLRNDQAWRRRAGAPGAGQRGRLAGKIGSLRRFKDDVSEVKAGMECGITLDRFNDIKVGDVIEVFAMERVATTV
jgi:translation initiation factor IF-2